MSPKPKNSGLNILQVHNRTLQVGGADVVVRQESELISTFAEVHQLFADNSDISATMFGKTLTALRLPYSLKGRSAIKKAIKRHKPDIVHIHNLFPLFSPSIIDECVKQGVKTVMTLHDYRLFYPNALFFHNGKIDMRGLETSCLLTLKDRVYKNSWFATLSSALMVEIHKYRDTWNKLDKIIILTEHSRELLIKGGIKPEKIVLKPNFVHDVQHEISPYSPGYKYYVLAGRVSEEKGIDTAIEAWSGEKMKHPLLIVGNSDIIESYKRKTRGNDAIVWKGFAEHREVLSYMKGAEAVIAPSLCYETFGMTIIEAFSCGTPVIATRLGSRKFIVNHGDNGLLFKTGDVNELRATVSFFEDQGLREEMSTYARATYERYYTDTLNAEMLKNIYFNLIPEKRPWNKVTASV